MKPEHHRKLVELERQLREEDLPNYWLFRLFPYLLAFQNSSELLELLYGVLLAVPSLLAVCVLLFFGAGQLYLWRYPIAPPEQREIDDVFVEITDDLTYLEAWWAWESRWTVVALFFALWAAVTVFQSTMSPKQRFRTPTSILATANKSAPHLTLPSITALQWPPSVAGSRATPRLSSPPAAAASSPGLERDHLAVARQLAGSRPVASPPPPPIRSLAELDQLLQRQALEETAASAHARAAPLPLDEPSFWGAALPNTGSGFSQDSGPHLSFPPAAGVTSLHSPASGAPTSLFRAAPLSKDGKITVQYRSGAPDVPPALTGFNGSGGGEGATEAQRLLGVSEAIWSELGIFNRRTAEAKAKEFFRDICVELLNEVDSCDAWLRAHGMGDLDCSHSLEEAAVSATPPAAGFGAAPTTSTRFGIGFGGASTGFGSAASKPSGFGGGFGGSKGFGTGTLGFGANAQVPAATLTKRAVLTQEREMTRQPQAQTALRPTTAGFGSVGATFGAAAAPASSSPITPAMAFERMQNLDRRLDLEERLDVFGTFPAFGIVASAERSKQQQFLLRRLRSWASSPIALRDEEAAAHSFTGGVRARHVPETAGGALLSSDPHLMLHVLRFGVQGLEPFVRFGYITSDFESDISICVGDVGAPYFYVMYRAKPMDVSSDSVPSITATQPPPTRSQRRSVSVNPRRRHQFTERIDVPALLMQLHQYGDRVTGPQLKSLRALAAASSGSEEDKEVVLPTTPGEHSVWEAVLLLVGLVHRYHEGVYRGIRGTLDLDRCGLSRVLSSSSALHTAPLGTRSVNASDAGWLSGRSLFADQQKN